MKFLYIYIYIYIERERCNIYIYIYFFSHVVGAPLEGAGGVGALAGLHDRADDPSEEIVQANIIRYDIL